MKEIAILALPGVQLLDVAGPLDVFAQANLQAGRVLYQCIVVGISAGAIRSSSGARLYADGSIKDVVRKLDTVLIAGAPNAGSRKLHSATIEWIRESANRARRYGSVCTGALLLAQCGLLKKQRVTTHWACAKELSEAYPLLRVEEDALYVRDGKLRTSAGVTAGLDLALSLVEEDCGREIAKQVASHLVMYFKRPGGQLQFSRAGESSLGGRSALQEVQRWALANLASELSIESLANHVGLSPRHFARLFTSDIGETPAAWIEQARVKAARELLEECGDSPKQVAGKVGFANVDTFRRSFVKHVGITPAVYRKRFHST
ncbi:MAG: GlxA family transcriptional regulator [Cellvibrio sp.]|uniref:GlxA family transcriptional regulator n=1 Tax=Cellvibrio sp. TaxID=1965322 RepID=UPI0031A80152